MYSFGSPLPAGVPSYAPQAIPVQPAFSTPLSSTPFPTYPVLGTTYQGTYLPSAGASPLTLGGISSYTTTPQAFPSAFSTTTTTPVSFLPSAFPAGAISSTATLPPSIFPTTTLQPTTLPAATTTLTLPPQTTPVAAPVPAAEGKVLVCGSARMFAEQVTKAAEAIKAMQDAARKEPGCVHFIWSQCLDDPLLLNIFEVWETEAALSTHLESEHVRAFKEVVTDIFVEDPHVQKATVSSAFEDI